MPGGLTRLLLTTDAVGGVWRYSLDLAHGLRVRGIEVVLAVLGPAADAAQRRAAEGITLVQTGLPLDWTAEDPEALEQTSMRLATLAALTGVSGVHLHAPALVGRARWPVPVIAVAHSCVGTWWRAMRDGAPPGDFAWRITATGAGLRAADAVIAPSRAHAEAVRGVYGTVPIIVVHNGSDPEAATAVRDRAVLTAGRLWDEAKGAAAIDRAAAGLGAPVRAAGPVAGPNGARIELRHVVALGHLDAAAMARAYASASVFVSMARYEPFGLSVLEAAQAGMRLVLADIPTFRELWDGAATFVADADALPAALRAALDAEGDGGARARALRFTRDAMVDGTLAVHRALKPSPGRTALAGGLPLGSASPVRAGPALARWELR